MPEMLKKGYPGLEASSISHGGQEQSMQNSRPISKKKETGCAPIMKVSHSSASLGQLTTGCLKAGLE